MHWKQQTTAEHHCCVGRLYVGEVHRLIPEAWESMIGTVPADRTDWHRANADRPWRGWVMSDDGGEEIGRYETAGAAKTAVENKVSELMRASGPDRCRDADADGLG
jgi:hypothetical protein